MNKDTSYPAPFKAFAPFDGLVIILLVAGAVSCIPFLGSLTPASVVVYRDNQVIATFPIDQYKEFAVTGSLGQVAIDIGPSGARVYRAHCPNQICVHSAPIKRPGEQIICVPNHVVVEIGGAKQPLKGVDAIVQ
jgi:hypothetical protein